MYLYYLLPVLFVLSLIEGQRMDNAQTCDDIKLLTGADGDYILDPDGTGGKPGYRVTCTNMASTPKEYLVLTNTRAKYTSTDFNSGSVTSDDNSHTLHTYYNKLLIENTNTGLERVEVFAGGVDPSSDRLAYASTVISPSGSSVTSNSLSVSSVAYSYFQTCNGNNADANINLFNTAFRVADITAFSVVGTTPQEAIDPSTDRKNFNFTGSGNCGNLQASASGSASNSIYLDVVAAYDAPNCIAGSVLDGQNLCQPVSGICVAASVSATESTNPPYIVSQAISTDEYTLKLAIPFTASRLVTNISLSDNPNCNFPGYQWVKGFDSASCLDTYTLSIPWNYAYQAGSLNGQYADACGLIQSTGVDVIKYDGTISVTFIDQLGVIDPVRGITQTRTTTTASSMQVVFPTTITISSSPVTLFANTRLISAVIQQSYNPNSRQMIITLFTSVQGPFRLTSIDYDTIPFNVSGQTPILTVDCNNGSNPCNQQWSLNFSLINGGCKFDGSYLLNSNVYCQPSTSASNCPILSNEVNPMSFSIASSDACAVVSTTSSLNGALSSWKAYSAGQFSGQQSAFFLDVPTYYQFAVTSQGPVLALVNITSVIATDASGNPQTIYSIAAPQNSKGNFRQTVASAASFVITNEFDFEYNSNWFGVIAVDSQVASTVTVSASVTYSTAKGRTIKRVSSQNVQSSYMVMVSLDPSQSDSGASSISRPVFLLACIIGLLLLL